MCELHFHHVHFNEGVFILGQNLYTLDIIVTLTSVKEYSHVSLSL